MWHPSSLLTWLLDLHAEGHFKNSNGHHFCPDLCKFLRMPAEGRRAFNESYQKQVEGTEDPMIQISAIWMERLLSEETNPDLFLEKLQEDLETIQRLLESIEERDSYEICNDFTSFLKQIKTPLRPDTFSIVDTDDWQDLLLCGTEVLGSCQSITGSPDHNQCLLAYILDGKNRMLAIKDSQGKIIARSIFRLLWDEERCKPVLFQERLYTNIADENIKKALYDYAKERAHYLGCPLYKENHSLSEPVMLTSFDSSAPIEYVDALKGAQVNGCFTIRNAYKVPLEP